MNGPFADADREDLELLEERAARLAEAGTEDDAERLGALVVTVEKERYALPVSAVREVVSDYRVTPVPCAPVWVRGVLNLRGEIVSVTDLAVVLGLRPEGAARPAPLIVVSDGSVTTALVVDGVEEIALVAADDLIPLLATASRAHAESVTGSFDTEDGPVALLEPAALLVPVGAEG